MARLVLVGLVAVGLGVGVWALWPRGDVPATTTTSLPLGSPTTRPDDATTSTPLEGTTTTSQIESHVVQTVEEAEAIMRELWFGWFEGIYNQDEERIREVVATEEQVEQAKSLFDEMEFVTRPSPTSIAIESLEILRSDDDCLVLWAQADSSAFRGEDARGEAVYVLRRVDDGWGLASSWAYREDLWEQDCAVSLG